MRTRLILLALQAFYLAGPGPYMCRRDPIKERDKYWIFIERVLRRICWTHKLFFADNPLSAQSRRSCNPSHCVSSERRMAFYPERYPNKSNWWFSGWHETL